MSSAPTLLPLPGATAASAHAARPRIDVVVPVHNEQRALPWSIRRLHDHLSAELPYDGRIVIADNASTDATRRIAAALAADLPGVEVLELPEKGRGRALRAAWSRSDADVLVYMDVDLSTDLRALLPLVAPLVSGHSDVAIGTRLADGARVVRGPRRELISRSYNRLLHVSLGARFSDAQCGFKAVRADAARRLLPGVVDEGWFFDTELLVLAQREGLRIHEVPVDWVDDPDSRVDVVRTALEDLRGIARLLAGARLTRFLAIGVCSTIAHALLFVLLRGALGATGGNALALAITAVGNTQANRRFTFGVRGRRDLLRHHARTAWPRRHRAAWSWPCSSRPTSAPRRRATSRCGRGSSRAVRAGAARCARSPRCAAPPSSSPDPTAHDPRTSPCRPPPSPSPTAWPARAVTPVRGR